MKIFKKATAVMLVITFLACFLTGCSLRTLNGTYKSTGVLGETLTFDRENRVTGQLFGISLDGEYEIEDDMITFTYVTKLGIGAALSKSFLKKGDTIWIDGTEYVKQ